MTGVLEWHGLSLGDPAIDLQWLASAPDAAEDVYAAYAIGSGRAPDAHLRDRARLYAELEFGRWLLHGHDSDRADIVADAAELLRTLSDSVGAADLVEDAALDVDDALALLAQTPGAGPAVDTSMQTDAYSADELALWAEDAGGSGPVTAVEGMAPAAQSEPTGRGASGGSSDPEETQPLDLAMLRDDPDHVTAARDAERASRAAFQRWTSSSSE
ncbi:hypothetical protein [Microbacterium hominis]|uniref:hypothetical protein n=1 Tax=Microbacterium hominis TaxID=162426 RepID=UPI0020B72943|nr:hypothetical protein [Microbacterium hominis]